MRDGFLRENKPQLSINAYSEQPPYTKPHANLLVNGIGKLQTCKPPLKVAATL